MNDPRIFDEHPVALGARARRGAGRDGEQQPAAGAPRGRAGDAQGGARGWLAIDPKGVVGERGFDFANLFCNPDPQMAAAPGWLARQVEVVAGAAGMERERLLRWILAHAGLSAPWSLEDGDEPVLALTVAEIAAAELGA